MVVAICYIDLYILQFWVENRCKPTRFIETGIKSAFILKTSLAVAQPCENLIAERINDFDFMIVGVCYQNHIFVWDEVDA